MLEYLSPATSLINLLISGIKSIWNKSTIKKKKNIERKIISIQLLLEEIIDTAQEILMIMNENAKKKKLSDDENDKLIKVLYSQFYNLNLLLTLLHDDTAEEIMKLFKPKIRRRIIDLIFLKGSGLMDFIRCFRSVDKKKLPYVELPSIEWNHDSFIKEGISYSNQLFQHSTKKKVLIYDQLQKQEQIVNELIECSKELSDFIGSQINIIDVVLCKTKTQ